jgi:dihydroorotate dehydrogenase (NAD+) catalytic subunit
VKLPIIGMGGIANADDVLEFMIAGANAVQVGTMNFVDPFIWEKLKEGLRCYMEAHTITRLQDIVGTVDTTSREKAWISS